MSLKVESWMTRLQCKEGIQIPNSTFDLTKKKDPSTRNFNMKTGIGDWKPRNLKLSNK